MTTDAITTEPTFYPTIPNCPLCPQCQRKPSYSAAFYLPYSSNHLYSAHKDQATFDYQDYSQIAGNIIRIAYVDNAALHRKCLQRKYSIMYLVLQI